ncbi:MAG: rhodanese-like domain-containing protein [Alphaproteobacteria bacterium]|jgi:rhodanese-related sulfurtransferase|nr:rhodanese-like domain-containing protein [Alphaproteobacteria bacterium]
MTIKTIIPMDLYRRIKMGHNVVLVDVRTQDEFDEGHIQNALSFPIEFFFAKDVIQKINTTYPESPTIYVISGSGSKANEATLLLAAENYEYIMLVEGGMQAWEKIGLPVRRPRSKLIAGQHLEITQQILIAIGGTVTVATLLGTLVNSAFLAITLLAGMGIAYEGIFGTDYLRQFLARMSWNREG